MWFHKAVYTLLVLNVGVAGSTVDIPATTREEGLMAMIQKKLDILGSRNLRSTIFLLSIDNEEDDNADAKSVKNKDPFQICDMVELFLGDFFQGQDPLKGGHCDCSGNLVNATHVVCDFPHVCDEMMDDSLCADMAINVTLTGFLDEHGRFGPDPKVNISACMEPDLPNIEMMCLTMDFMKPKFFFPTACSFSYGEKECVCVIDDEVPCYDFDCSSALPDPLDMYIVSNKCKKVDLSENGLDVSVFLPALADFPSDGEKIPSTSMEANFLEQAAEWKEEHVGN